MLFKNDIFELEGARLRLLHADVPADNAWCIYLDSDTAWPIRLPYAEISDLQSPSKEEPAPTTHSEARLRKCSDAWARLQPLIHKHGNKLFHSSMRNRLIVEYAQEIRCSVVTLRKDLRRYWQRGQNKFALLPDYDKSGHAKEAAAGGLVGITAGRGSKARLGHGTYQLSPVDLANMKVVIERGYLKDSRISAVDAYRELVAEHYRYEDGNQRLYPNPLGELPSLRQFRYFLAKNYDIEVRLRGREGNTDFEREHRKVLGSVLADCLGVGHYYEIDATIVDVYLVAQDDRNKIIGKPTLYLIIDRKSRLIVGFYFGLENASWIAAQQAILSISEDKHALCARYGVEYDPADWPAHQVFPQEFVADRGDMISHASTSIAEELQVTVTNLPSKRPDWKPLVECGFRLFHNAIRPITPAYDPPSNATKRRGKHYEKDACLTVNEFGNLILNTIIQNNRREILKYPLSRAELLAGVRPSPLELWNFGIASRSGLLTRFPEEHVRFALLRRDTATVTEHGVHFRGCYYAFQKAISEKWFELARKRRFQVNVFFDPRLVDQIYVQSLQGKGSPQLATLTQKSLDYSGLSFEEVRYFELLRDAVRQESGPQRLQNSIELSDKTKPVTTHAKRSLKATGNQSRSARRADTKPARHQALSVERQRAAQLEPPQTLETRSSSLASGSSEASELASTRQAELAAILARMRA